MEINNLIPSAEQFAGLFETTGWNEKYELSKEELYQCICNSWYVVSVYDNGGLVGFGRVLSDGYSHAMILDVIVHPLYQGKGIGKQVMGNIVSFCKSHKIRDIQLFSAKGKSGFYQKVGFQSRPENAPGMEIKKYW